MERNFCHLIIFPSAFLGPSGLAPRYLPNSGNDSLGIDMQQLRLMFHPDGRSRRDGLFVDDIVNVHQKTIFVHEIIMDIRFQVSPGFVVDLHKPFPRNQIGRTEALPPDHPFFTPVGLDHSVSMPDNLERMPSRIISGELSPFLLVPGKAGAEKPGQDEDQEYCENGEHNQADFQPLRPSAKFGDRTPEFIFHPFLHRLEKPPKDFTLNRHPY
jgi:hypothetical protein